MNSRETHAAAKSGRGVQQKSKPESTADMPPFTDEVSTSSKPSLAGDAAPQMRIEPDRVVCRACAEEILTRGSRRFRYPFAHCSHCGPQFSILRRLPYEHANTSFAPFDRCFACDAEYYDPTNRHFHTETAVCAQCGPRATLIRLDGGPILVEQHSALDDVDAACSLIQRGEVVAIKGVGGWQLACDATNVAAVARLRRVKQNGTRPLPLMARDLHVIARYCAISVEEELQLTSAQGPIVILRATGGEKLPDGVAPGLRTLGFMLPTTALHLLLMQRMNRPVVMTSGNLSGAPQIIDDDEAFETFGVTVRFALTHNYRIANRVEDSVVRVMSKRPRILRRARGYAPAALKLPAGFERASDLVATGGDHKAVFCMLKEGVAIPAPHYADVTDDEACKAYQGVICQFRSRLRHKVSAIAIDWQHHYLSSAMARAYTAQWQLGLIEVAHLHAHLSSCLAENGYSPRRPLVLGVVLDGLGWNEEGARQGSEFLLGDYRGFKPLASLKPIPMSAREIGEREPWRDLVAHLTAAIGWREFTTTFGGLDLCSALQEKWRREVDLQPEGGLRYISSCGRLFNAVAAALGICREGQTYDSEAATRLEAIVDESALGGAPAYPVSLQRAAARDLPYIDPTGMWQGLLDDLLRKVPGSVVAARFHHWLAASLAAMAAYLSLRKNGEERQLPTVALSGGCFQNRILLEETERQLRQSGFAILTHAQLPPHNGGLCFGQAAVGAAQILDPAR